MWVKLNRCCNLESLLIRFFSRMRWARTTHHCFIVLRFAQLPTSPQCPINLCPVTQQLFFQTALTETTHASQLLEKLYKVIGPFDILLVALSMQLKRGVRSYVASQERMNWQIKSLLPFTNKKEGGSCPN